MLNRRSLLYSSVLAVGVVIFAEATSTVSGPVTDNGKTAALLLTTAFNEKNVAGAFDRYVGSSYRQHNPFAADGKEAAIAFLTDAVAKGSFHYDIKRVIADGDMVAVHSRVTYSSDDRGNAVVDIFRFDHGKVVEHWDVVQPIPEHPGNSNTMF